MDSEEKSKFGFFRRFDGVAIIVLVLLGILGGYLFYRTYVSLGGVRGWLAVIGRWFVQLAWVIAACVAYIIYFAVLHIVISIVTGTRLRRVKVFISFQHDYESIATEIQNGLEGSDIEVVRLPFRRDRDHDEVIRDSLHMVKVADAVVFVPGPIPSWTAHEMGVAVADHKPVAAIKHLPDQRLSDSLYRGCPVFAWDKLRACKVVPLRRFLAFSAKSRADVWPQFFRTVAGFADKVIAGLIAWWVISIVIREVERFLFAFAPRKAEVVAAGWTWAVFVLLAVAFAVGFGQAFARRARGLAVARQIILTGEATYSEFAAVFSLLKADASILEVLEKVPLSPRRQEAQAG